MSEQAEIIGLKSKLAEKNQLFIEAQDHLRSLTEKLNLAKSTLKFYADKDQMAFPWIHEMAQDRGKQARMCLKKIGTNTNSHTPCAAVR